MYNFVRELRCELDLPKSIARCWFQKYVETPYGKYAQVDSGERY